MKSKKVRTIAEGNVISRDCWRWRN